MATVFSHALVGYTFSQMAPVPKTRAFVFWMTFLPVIPDFDYIGWALHVPYDSLWGHRGMTHSILFALLLSVLVTVLLIRNHRGKVLAFLFLATTSHGILDAFTNGGLGVAFFAPYTLARYFFPWTPIEVSPMGVRFFSERGLVVLLSELVWIALPCIAMLAGLRLLNRKNLN